MSESVCCLVRASTELPKNTVANAVCGKRKILPGNLEQYFEIGHFRWNSQLNQDLSEGVPA